MKQLNLIEKAFFLKKISLFSDLDLDILIAIADKMNQDIYDPNEKVFTIHQRANRMYFIAEGSIKILNEKNELITSLSKNHFFGEESLFNQKTRQYAATCDTQALILTLSQINVFTIISECPSIALSLLQTYTKNVTFQSKE